MGAAASGCSRGCVRGARGASGPPWTVHRAVAASASDTVVRRDVEIGSRASLVWDSSRKSILALRLLRDTIYRRAAGAVKTIEYPREPGPSANEPKNLKNISAVSSELGAELASKNDDESLHSKRSLSTVPASRNGRGKTEHGERRE